MLTLLLHAIQLHVVLSGVLEYNIYTWGNNKEGQCGVRVHPDEMERDITRPRAVTTLTGNNALDVALGSSHTVALTTTLDVFTWGSNDEGQLGIGGNTNQNIPILVTELKGLRITRVAAGGCHSAAVDKWGHLFTWGCNHHGQLGRTDTRPDYAIPVPFFRNRPVAKINLGRAHTAAITEHGDLYTWGWGHQGQLGHGVVRDEFEPRVVESLAEYLTLQVSCGCQHTIVLLGNMSTYVFGNNDYGQLGVGSLEKIITPTLVQDLENLQPLQVAAGCNHSAVVTIRGRLWMWGRNNVGQLGLGDKSNRRIPTNLDNDKIGDDWAMGVALGSMHTLIKTKLQLVFATGYGAKGQLGLFDNNNRTFPIRLSSLGPRTYRLSAGESHSACITEDLKDPEPFERLTSPILARQKEEIKIKLDDPEAQQVDTKELGQAYKEVIRVSLTPQEEDVKQLTDPHHCSFTRVPHTSWEHRGAARVEVKRGEGNTHLTIVNEGENGRGVVPSVPVLGGVQYRLEVTAQTVGSEQEQQPRAKLSLKSLAITSPTEWPPSDSHLMTDCVGGMRAARIHVDGGGYTPTDGVYIYQGKKNDRATFSNPRTGANIFWEPSGSSGVWGITHNNHARYTSKGFSKLPPLTTTHLGQRYNAATSLYQAYRSGHCRLDNNTKPKTPFGTAAGTTEADCMLKCNPDRTCLAVAHDPSKKECEFYCSQFGGLCTNWGTTVGAHCYRGVDGAAGVTCFAKRSSCGEILMLGLPPLPSVSLEIDCPVGLSVPHSTVTESLETLTNVFSVPENVTSVTIVLSFPTGSKVGDMIKVHRTVLTPVLCEAGDSELTSDKVTENRESQWLDPHQTEKFDADHWFESGYESPSLSGQSVSADGSYPEGGDQETLAIDAAAQKDSGKTTAAVVDALEGEDLFQSRAKQQFYFPQAHKQQQQQRQQQHHQQQLVQHKQDTLTTTTTTPVLEDVVDDDDQKTADAAAENRAQAQVEATEANGIRNNPTTTTTTTTPGTTTTTEPPKDKRSPIAMKKHTLPTTDPLGVIFRRIHRTIVNTTDTSDNTNDYNIDDLNSNNNNGNNNGNNNNNNNGNNNNNNNNGGNGNNGNNNGGNNGDDNNNNNGSSGRRKNRRTLVDAYAYQHHRTLVDGDLLVNRRTLESVRTHRTANPRPLADDN